MANRPWLDAAWLQEQAAAGRSATDLAADLDVPADRIRMAARSRGVTLPKHGSAPDAATTYLDATWLREQAAQGHSATDLARDLGVPVHRIWLATSRRGVTLPRHQPDRSARSAQPVWRSGVDAAWLQAQIDAGRTQAAIAADLGTHRVAVRELCRELGVRPRRSVVEQVLGDAGPGEGVVAEAWLVLDPKQKSHLNLFRVWLAAAGVTLDQATERHVLGYAAAEVAAGAAPGTIALHVAAVDQYDQNRRVPSRTGLARKLLRARRRGLARDPLAPAAPLVVLEPLMATDPVRDAQSPQVSVCKATVISSLQGHLGTDVAGVRAALRAGRVQFGSDGTIHVDGAQLPAAVPPGTPDVDPHVAVAALARLGRLDQFDGRAPFIPAVRQGVADPAWRTARYRKWCVADAVLDVWLTASFWHALRGGAAGGIPLSRLRPEHHNVPFGVKTKGGQIVPVRIEHTPDHRMCHACAAGRLTDLLDQLGLDGATFLDDLPGSAKTTLERRVAAAGLPEGAVTAGTPRRTMATMFWARHRNLEMLRLLLAHAPGSVSTHRYVSTTRYVQDLPELDLANPAYDLERWAAGVEARTARRVERHATRPAKDLPWSNPRSAAEVDAAIDAAIEELDEHGLIGPPRNPAAVEARTDFVIFCNEHDLEPRDPRTLAVFSYYEIEEYGLPVSKVKSKVLHILAAEEDPARRNAWRKDVDHYLERVEKEAPPDVQQAPLLSRAEILPWAAALPEDLQVMLIAGWCFALRPGSAALVTAADLDVHDDRVMCTVRGNNKRRSGATYTVTVPTTGDDLCPSRLAAINPEPGRSLAGMPLSDRTTARQATSYSARAWQRIRATLTDAGYTDAALAVTGMSMRHSRATQHFTEHRDLIRTQVLLGHSRPDYTLHYLTRLDPYIRSHAANIMADHINHLATVGADLMRQQVRELLTAAPRTDVLSQAG